MSYKIIYNFFTSVGDGLIEEKKPPDPDETADASCLTIHSSCKSTYQSVIAFGYGFQFTENLYTAGLYSPHTSSASAPSSLATAIRTPSLQIHFSLHGRELRIAAPDR